MAKKQPPPEPLARGAEDFGAVVSDVADVETDDEPDEGPPPRKPAAKAPPKRGTVPRVVDPRDRAPAGLTRYKVRCTDHGAAYPVRYVLATGEGSARACYLAELALPAAAKLAVTVLCD